MKNRVLIALEERLKKSRFHHTLRVTDMAMTLAKVSNISVEKAEIAGLFHDLAKNLSDDEMVIYIKTYNIKIDELVGRNLYLAHGMIAADIAKRDYGIGDEEIIEAITYHTIGGPNLSPLAKLIYVADYIEPKRNFEGVEVIRAIALSGALDQALLMTIENQMTFLLKGHKEIHPNALQMRNELVRQLKKSEDLK